MNKWIGAVSVAVIGLVGGVLVLRGYAGAPLGTGQDPQQDGPKASAGEAKKEIRTIKTSGSATIKTKPDMARVYLGVDTTAKTIKAAREENAERMKKVLDATQALQIPDLKAKTVNITVVPVYRRRPNEEENILIGYQVANSFTVLISNPDATALANSASRVLDAALENGANVAQQIVFFKRDDTEIRRQAMTKAVQDALGNAAALAEGANVHVGATITISDEPEYNYTYPMQSHNAPLGRTAGGDTPVLAGELEITCRVSVTCAF
jgi:uncharacterized protein YggE